MQGACQIYNFVALSTSTLTIISTMIVTPLLPLNERLSNANTFHNQFFFDAS